MFQWDVYNENHDMISKEEGFIFSRFQYVNSENVVLLLNEDWQFKSSKGKFDYIQVYLRDMSNPQMIGSCDKVWDQYKIIITHSND